MPSAEEIRDSNMATLAGVHAVYIEAIREAFGQEGLEVIGEANRINGLSIGEEALKQGQLKPDDLRSIYEFFQASSVYFGFKMELQKVTENELEIRVTGCPWIETFKKMAQEDICKWVCKTDEGIAQALDPYLRLELPKCMMRGDDYCVYRWYRAEK